jgi:hypothetical protein
MHRASFFSARVKVKNARRRQWINLKSDVILSEA